MSEITNQVSSSIEGLTRQFDLIAHNLANVSTNGYKRQYNDFSKSLKAMESASENKDGQPESVSTTYDFSQGSFTQTNRPLDIALCGKGFFEIETPQGPLYTRNGMFRLDPNGQLVDLSGRFVAGQRGPITIPPTVGLSEINISNEGNISANGIPIETLKLVDFQEDTQKLTAAGMNCFQAPNGLKPEEAENLVVKQGFQEGSNVKMVEELVNMITVTRMYEANMRFLTSTKDVSSSLLSVAMS